MENDFYKTFSWRYVDLFKGLQLIKDSLDFIDQNRKYYYIPLSGQLRALFVLPHDKNGNIIDTTKGKRVYNSTNIFNIAEELKIDLSVYIRKQKYTNKDNQYFSHLFDTTVFPTEENTIKISLKDWMELDLVVLEGKRIKIWDIIKKVADKNGGAHYDKTIPSHDALLFNTKNANDTSVLFLFLYKIGRVLLNVGVKVLKSEFDFHIVVPLFFNRLSYSSPKSILSFHTRKSFPMQITLTPDNRVMVTFIDLDDDIYECELCKIESTGKYLLNVGCELTEKMDIKTVVYDKSKIMKSNFLFPVFIGRCDFIERNMKLCDDGMVLGLLANVCIFRKVLSQDEYLKLCNSLCDNVNEVEVLDGEHKCLVMCNDKIGKEYAIERKYLNIDEFMSIKESPVF